MVYKSFYIKIIIIGILILLTAYLTAWITLNTDFIHTIIFLHILFVFELVWLIYFVNKTNRMLTAFFSSIYENGISTKFKKTPQGKSFKILSEKLNNVIETIYKARIERENEHHYLKYIVEHLNTGIISLENNNKIDLINKAGLRLLGAEHIFTIDDCKNYGKKFYQALLTIRTGENQLVPAIIHNELIELSLRASEFKLFNKSYKIISFHDLREELDQKEINAWQNVIKVMAHEILSSVSPINSLSQHLNDLLQKDKIEYIPDTEEGLKIIQQRSEGLMAFVNKYRKLSDIPLPVIEEYNINKVVNEAIVLVNSEFNISSILPGHFSDKEMKVPVDKNLLIQTILNIVRNSVQATKNMSEPKIEINIYTKGIYLNIEVVDNGTGIDEEDLQNIFIPFFTTKDGGSGIGLTIAKQLTIAQNGRLEIFSKKGKGTKVLIQFKHTS